MMDAQDATTLQSVALEGIDYIADAGFTKPVTLLKLEDREEVILVVALHNALLKSKAELDQLIEGMSVLGVAEMVQKYPAIMEMFLTSSGNQDLTAG